MYRVAQIKLHPWHFCWTFSNLNRSINYFTTRNRTKLSTKLV